MKLRFGYSTTLLTIGLALVLSIPVANAKPDPIAGKFRIGLQLYTVRDECAKDMGGTLKKVADMGYAGVEFAGYFGHSAKELRQMLKDDHLACYGSHIGMSDLEGENFDKTVAFCKEIDTRLLVIPSIPDQGRNTMAALLGTCKKLDEYAARLEKKGIVLAYHDHAGDFHPLDGEVPWNIIFSHTDPRVKIEFDIGNALEAGEQAAPYLTKYPGRVISVHVKDFSSTNPQSLLGEGDENWNVVVPLLKSRSGPRYLIIEQEVYPVPPMAAAEKCLHNFETMLMKPN